MKVSIVIQILCICAMGMFVGCGPSGPTNAKEASGEYVFVYKTGEIEVLGLWEDWKYKQELYPDVSSYRGRLTLTYSNEGTWSYTNTEIIMSHWLSFCQYPNPRKRVDPPQRFFKLSGIWYPTNSELNAVLWLSQKEMGYGLIRVNSRDEVTWTNNLVP